MAGMMSKESQIKKRLEKEEKRKAALPPPPKPPRVVTMEERAAAVRDRLANRQVVVMRYPNGKLNRRFIFMLALMGAALVVALVFITRF
jgi:hypothetical protein